MKRASGLQRAYEFHDQRSKYRVIHFARQSRCLAVQSGNPVRAKRGVYRGIDFDQWVVKLILSRDC